MVVVVMRVTIDGGCDDDSEIIVVVMMIVTDDGSRNVVFLIPFSFAIFVTSYSRESFLFTPGDSSPCRIR